MHAASGSAVFFIQSCSALETAFALHHFAMWFQLNEALTWLPFLFTMYVVMCAREMQGTQVTIQFCFSFSLHTLEKKNLKKINKRLFNVNHLSF